MTSSLFAVLILVIVLGAVGAFLLSTRVRVGALVKQYGTMPPPMIGAISILFGLFVGFSSAEISTRGGGLRLATQREVSAARSILNFTTGVGPRAYAVREAMVEYLQVVTTTESAWLQSRAASEPPGAGPVYSLNLVATGFVQQPGVSDVLKTVLLNRVEDLTNARTDRLTLSRASGSIPQWMALAALVLVTQLVGAMAVAGQRGGSFVFLTGFTLTAAVGLVYLGLTDGLIGPSRSTEQTAPFAALLASTPPLSSPATDTTARMAQAGKVVIGAWTDTFPFSYPDGHGGIAGFSIDLCRAIVERVRTASELGPVTVEVVPLTPANRVAMVENSTVDMECDLTTETSSRDQSVAFLDTIFYGTTQVGVLARSEIKDVSGLKGKRVLAVTGSSNIQAIAELNDKQHLGITVVPAPGTPEGFQMLAAESGDAMVSSDVLLRSQVETSPHPDDYRTFDSGLGARSYGIMIRQGNDAFQTAAVTALHDIQRSGEFVSLYDRWFTQAPPAGGVNLRLPIGPELQRKISGRP